VRYDKHGTAGERQRTFEDGEQKSPQGGDFAKIEKEFARTQAEGGARARDQRGGREANDCQEAARLIVNCNRIKRGQ